MAMRLKGDIQLEITDTVSSAVVIDWGEELLDSKARSSLRTGNVYHEIWHMQKGKAWRGLGLKAFRYVTLTDYPSVLSKERIKGLQVKSDAGGEYSTFTSNNLNLNKIWNLGKHTYDATESDIITDSITRERQAYEGDNLIYQQLAYSMSGDPLPTRNTWNALIEEPTNYTEYRLMTPIGVLEDYLHTGDKTYVESVYDQLVALMNVVEYDNAIGLVHATSDTTDLVDWPRSETAGYNFELTEYKTVINAVAYKTYLSLSDLARICNHSSDAQQYSDIAQSIKKSMIDRLYDSNSSTFYDGLDVNGNVIEHHISQNDYFSLWAGVYESQQEADRIAETITKNDVQEAGSIYAAYFLYSGLYQSGNGLEATKLLIGNGKRSYISVLEQLGATITPEAWNPQIKPNMSFSHPWGAGGPAAMSSGLAGVHATEAGWSQAACWVQIQAGQTVSTQTPTARGNVSVKADAHTDHTNLAVAVPSGMRVTINIRITLRNPIVELDGKQETAFELHDGIISLKVNAGSHRITISV